LRDVTKNYGAVTALEGIGLDIHAGEWLAVMGPSGSGKTTLLNLLAGLDRADSGSIEVDHAKLHEMDEARITRYRRDAVGLIFQQFHLLPYLSALENVMVAQYYHSLADSDEAARALRDVGLGDLIDRRPSELSGGEQQRVCIARALINHPKLLLADEPTGNLDEENERKVLELFSRLHRAGHTLVVVTHSAHVGRLADRRIELHHGKISDLTITNSELEERYDHSLEHMWYLHEQNDPITIGTMELPDVVDPEPTIQELVERGWAVRNGDEIGFTSKGEERARNLVRRHRLAECMMAGTLHLSDQQVKETACRMEHILDPGVTVAICNFLKHPEECPHGKVIPAGSCCPRAGEGLHTGP
jgi:putative ABC transport system ATP-binding protein